MLILNDVHLGAERSAGTTLQSRRQIKDYLQAQFKTMLEQWNGDLLIAGDLFDSFSVEVSRVLETFFTIADWLKDNPHKSINLMQGNHDVAKNSEKTSSFAFLCELLVKLYPTQVRVFDKGLATIHCPGLPPVHVISHVTNQDLFNIELEKACDLDPGYLVLHANCDNVYAEQADHSLNVGEDWLDKLIAAGHTLIFAHEHQAKTERQGKVIVMGNQWPSSVADCLVHGIAQKDGCKYAHALTHAGLERIQTWTAAGDYIEVDWVGLDLTGLETKARFIRVTGKASTDDASQVISAISRYRQGSDALVITNAVKLDGIEGLDDLHTLSAERLASVDVMAALCEELTPEEIVVVKQLLED